MSTMTVPATAETVFAQLQVEGCYVQSAESMIAELWSAVRVLTNAEREERLPTASDVGDLSDAIYGALNWISEVHTGKHASEDDLVMSTPNLLAGLAVLQRSQQAVGEALQEGIADDLARAAGSGAVEFGRY